MVSTRQEKISSGKDKERIIKPKAPAKENVMQK